MHRMSQDTFRVFISHKSDDAELAKVVAAELDGLAPGRIRCWVSGDDLAAGADWEREIKRELAQSHLLVLLFTTPHHTWDWCLYEVGLFIRFEADEVTAVACLYGTDATPPAPLHQVQCVRATAEALTQQLLRPLCTQTWEVSDTWQRGALLPDVSDDVLATTAKRIARKFRYVLERAQPDATDDTYTYRPCHRIVLDLTHCGPTMSWKGIPRDARVIQGTDATTSYTLSLFRAHEGMSAWKWGDLIDEVGGDDEAWRRDLDASFLHSLTRRLWVPSMEVMRVWQPDGHQDRTYRPIVYEVERRVHGDEAVSATILLVPDEATPSITTD